MRAAFPYSRWEVAAIIVAFLVVGFVLEFGHFRGLPKAKLLPGERAVELACYAACLVPGAAVLVFGVDTAISWPVLVGMALVLVISIGYAGWLSTR